MILFDSVFSSTLVLPPSVNHRLQFIAVGSIRIFCNVFKSPRIVNPPTQMFTASAMLRTRRVLKKVNRFLFVGRMERKKLERPREKAAKRIRDSRRDAALKGRRPKACQPDTDSTQIGGGMRNDPGHTSSYQIQALSSHMLNNFYINISSLYNL